MISAGVDTSSVSMRVRDLRTLRSYLELMGMSQRALASRAGVAPATVNHLMSGRRPCCSGETAAAIERALQCPTGLFFEPSRAWPDRPRRRFGDADRARVD